MCAFRCPVFFSVKNASIDIEFIYIEIVIITFVNIVVI